MLKPLTSAQAQMPAQSLPAQLSIRALEPLRPLEPLEPLESLRRQVALPVLTHCSRAKSGMI